MKLHHRKWIESFNPATGEKLGEAPVFTEEDVRSAVAAAREAQAAWKRLSVRQRIATLLGRSV